MPTIITFDRGGTDRRPQIRFSGHSAIENGDRDTGIRLCATMSTLASVVEAYVETQGIGYSLSVCPGQIDGIPVRAIEWMYIDRERMDPIFETVKQITSLLAAQYPDYLQVRDVG